MKNMDNSTFDIIFIRKTHSIKLVVDKNDSNNGSRIGGFAPKYFDNKIEKYDLKDYWYYFTISNDIINIKDDNEISVFFPKEFSEYNKNYKYPEFPIKCIMHEISGRGNDDIVFNKYIRQHKIISQGLVEDEEKEDGETTVLEPNYGIKIGGEPALLQKEEYYYKDLINDNYQFIMQIDESEYLRDQIMGNEPFNHGIIYFYGKIKESIIEELVGGFWQN
jgi:hypothetical protein